MAEATQQAAFFSYSRDDSEFAIRLAEDLKAAGANVWLYQLDIEPGMPWDRSVEDAVRNCPSMLVILSPASVNSNNVRDEISFALSKQKRIIPVLYCECDVPFRLARPQRRASAGEAMVAAPESPVKTVAGTVRINPKDGQRYVWTPPGSYMMGCAPRRQ